MALEHESAARAFRSIRLGGRSFTWGARTYVMGILNVTPDSFSDGGSHADAASAVEAGERMVAEGADLIDIGGESTRPGFAPVPEEEQLERVLPVVAELSRRVEVPLSIDTRSARVARAALDAGAALVNDVSAFAFDPRMASLVAERGVAACAMHSLDLRALPENQVMERLVADLARLLARAELSSVAREALLIDPGIGFGKSGARNLTLLRELGRLRALGHPILVGASRKSFLGAITGRGARERLPESLAALVAAIREGADVLRVHDVAASVAAARVADALFRGVGA